MLQYSMTDVRSDIRHDLHVSHWKGILDESCHVGIAQLLSRELEAARGGRELHGSAKQGELDSQ